MARGMNASVSLARAMLILSSCLVFGTLIGLLPRSSGGANLRSEGNHEQQQKPAGGGGLFRPQLPDPSLLSRDGSPMHKGVENRAADEGEAFVWNGGFPAIQNQALDAADMSFSFSFEFEGSLSYDYYY